MKVILQKAHLTSLQNTASPLVTNSTDFINVVLTGSISLVSFFCLSNPFVLQARVQKRMMYTSLPVHAAVYLLRWEAKN